MQPLVQPGDDPACVQDRNDRQVLGVEPLEQHRLAVWVGPQESHGAHPVPALESEGLVLRVIMGPADFEDRTLPAGVDRYDQCGATVRRRSVDDETPLLQ